MRTLSSLLLSCFVLVQVIVAQPKGAVLDFTEDSYDFGQIKESDGPVSHKFEFINKGSQPLIIADVKPSCDCTTPEWTKNPVLPGTKGYIKATYDPKDRGGIFKKEIKINSNANGSPHVITISGSVVQKAPLMEVKYPINYVDVRITKTYLSFETVLNDAKKTDKIEFMNTSAAKQTIKFTKVPAHIKIIPSTMTLEPGKSGLFIFSIDAVIKNDWGFIIDYLPFTLNGKEDDKYKITTTATIAENFAAWKPDQKANAPIAIVDNSVFNFGSVKESEKVEHDFSIQNKGKSDLILRKISSSCGCTTFVTNDKTIKPGESGIIKVIFDSNGRKGDQTKAVTIICNSPSKSNITLTIKGTVE